MERDGSLEWPVLTSHTSSPLFTWPALDLRPVTFGPKTPSQQNLGAPDDPDAGRGAVRKDDAGGVFASDDFECYYGGARCKAPAPWEVGLEIENRGIYIKEK